MDLTSNETDSLISTYKYDMIAIYNKYHISYFEDDVDYLNILIEYRYTIGDKIISENHSKIMEIMDEYIGLLLYSNDENIKCNSLEIFNLIFNELTIYKHFDDETNSNYQLIIDDIPFYILWFKNIRLQQLISTKNRSLSKSDINELNRNKLFLIKYLLSICNYRQTSFICINEIIRLLQIIDWTLNSNIEKYGRLDKYMYYRAMYDVETKPINNIISNINNLIDKVDNHVLKYVDGKYLMNLLLINHML